MAAEMQDNLGFSSLYIGILAATTKEIAKTLLTTRFQFPLHRDPRCNKEEAVNKLKDMLVSVPFTSGSSLQLASAMPHLGDCQFQFPLHRDPRCNKADHQNPYTAMCCFSSLYIGILAATVITLGLRLLW